MGQNCSRKRTIEFSEDEWDTPISEVNQISIKKVKNDLTGEIGELEEHMKAQRDVLALLENQMSVLIRDEEILNQAVNDCKNEDDDDEKRRSKLRRKRRRNLTYYRSNELLIC